MVVCGSISDSVSTKNYSIGSVFGGIKCKQASGHLDGKAWVLRNYRRGVEKRIIVQNHLFSISLISILQNADNSLPKSTNILDLRGSRKNYMILTEIVSGGTARAKCWGQTQTEEGGG